MFFHARCGCTTSTSRRGALPSEDLGPVGSCSRGSSRRRAMISILSSSLNTLEWQTMKTSVQDGTVPTKRNVVLFVSLDNNIAQGPDHRSSPLPIYLSLPLFNLRGVAASTEVLVFGGATSVTSAVLASLESCSPAAVGLLRPRSLASLCAALSSLLDLTFLRPSDFLFLPFEICHRGHFIICRQVHIRYVFA